MSNFRSSILVKVPRKCTFKYEGFQSGRRTSCIYEVELPLYAYGDVDAVFGHFIRHTLLDKIFFKGNKFGPSKRIADAREKLEHFILSETYKFEDELADEIVAQDQEVEFQQGVNNTFIMDCVFTAEQEICFDDKFRDVMKNGTTDELMKLVSMESTMSQDMSQMLRNRDAELCKLKDVCEKAVEMTKDAVDLEEHSYNLSMLNEKLRIQAMIEKQRKEFSDAVGKIYHTGTLDTHYVDDDISPDQSELSTTPKLEESFTVYIGNQMKTMHNARMMQCERMSEFCHNVLLDDVGRNVHNSSRLNLLMSLYRRDLKAAVVLVERDPMYHVHARSDVFKLCESSVELHFDSLETQLKKIADTVRATNKSHRSSATHQRCFDSHQPRSADDVAFLRPGDVYVTCHSNLNSVQVVMHLVTDHHWDKVEVTSRHPYVNGLRNCVRLASRNAVGTLSLPLFLNKTMPADLPASYYQSKADLMFKCCKGFMMEVCSTGASNTTCAPFNSRVSHYNINFGIPKRLGQRTFESVVETFLQIFHLVPTVNG